MHLRTKKNSLKLFSNKLSYLIFAITFCFISLGFIFSLGKIKIVSTNNSVNIKHTKQTDRSFILNTTNILEDKDGNKIFVKLVSSLKDKETGLSNTSTLKIYEENGHIFTEGLLFIFDKAQVLTFWMKDMNFDLDLIWLNDYKDGNGVTNGKLKIVHVEKNISKESYNKKFPTLSKVYKNPQDKLAKYVLEINSGLFDKMNLKVGDEIKFQ